VAHRLGVGFCPSFRVVDPLRMQAACQTPLVQCAPPTWQVSPRGCSPGHSIFSAQLRKGPARVPAGGKVSPRRGSHLHVHDLAVDQERPRRCDLRRALRAKKGQHPHHQAPAPHGSAPPRRHALYRHRARPHNQMLVEATPGDRAKPRPNWSSAGAKTWSRWICPAGSGVNPEKSS